MRIFLTGVSCVGKTAIGKKLAALLECPFFDLDKEVEKFFGTSIEKLQGRFLTIYSFRKEASKALKQLLTQEESQNCVIALPPSGLMHDYWRVVKKAGGISVVLTDRPENILERISFYDVNSRPINKQLTEDEKRLYLKEIKKDIRYFRQTYKRADIEVDISGLDPDEAAVKLEKSLRPIL